MPQCRSTKAGRVAEPAREIGGRRQRLAVADSAGATLRGALPSCADDGNGFASNVRVRSEMPQAGCSASDAAKRLRAEPLHANDRHQGIREDAAHGCVGLEAFEAD